MPEAPMPPAVAPATLSAVPDGGSTLDYLAGGALKPPAMKDPFPAATAPAAAGSPPLPVDRRSFAVNFFMTKGLSQAAAEGAADSMARNESDLDPSAFNPEGGSAGAYGIGQWRGTRLAGLLARPNHNTLMGQLNYIWAELTGPEKATLAALQKAKTPAEAKQIWEADFERPDEPTGASAAGMPPDVMRVGWNAAQKYHKQLRADIAEAHAQMEEYGKLAAQQPAGSAEADKLLQQQFEASSRAAEALDKLAKEPPTYSPIEPLKNFGSLATVVAIFGGLLSRQPITAALGAAGTAMKAANQQNWDEYHTAFATWKAQTEMAVASLQAHSAEINEILSNRRLGFDEQQAELRALTAKFGMTTALQALQKNDFDTAYKIFADLPQIARQLQMNKQQIELLKAQTDKTRMEAGVAAQTYRFFGGTLGGQGSRAAQPEPSPASPAGSTQPVATPSPVGTPQAAETGAPGGAPSEPDWSRVGHPPATVPEWAWNDAIAYVRSGKAPAFGLQNVAMRAAFENAKTALLHQMGISPSQLPMIWANYEALKSARVKMLDSMTSGQGGTAVMAFNTVLDHIQLEAIPAVEALKNGNLQAANAFFQRLAEETGKSAPTNFDEIKVIVGDELAKAIIAGAGGRGPTQQDREQLQAILHRAESPTQLLDAIAIAKNMAGQRMLNTRRQYVSVGFSETDFEKMLSPIALKLMREQGVAEAAGAGKMGAGPIPGVGGGDPGRPPPGQATLRYNPETERLEPIQ